MKKKKIDEVLNSANSFLRDVFYLLSSIDFASMTTERNNFSSLFQIICMTSSNLRLGSAFELF